MLYKSINCVLTSILNSTFGACIIALEESSFAFLSQRGDISDKQLVVVKGYMVSKAQISPFSRMFKLDYCFFFAC